MDKPLTLKEAIAEANRCLNWKKPSCQEGCPISDDIPEFIEAVGRGNLGEARKIIARKSNLPADKVLQKTQGRVAFIGSGTAVAKEIDLPGKEDMSALKSEYEAAQDDGVKCLQNTAPSPRPPTHFLIV